MEEIVKDLIRDEGLRLHPYRDTAGKLTIGIGRNLDDRGITEAEALVLLGNDLEEVRRNLNGNVPWWTKMSEPRQRALRNMCLNLGWPRLSQFKKMLGAMELGDFEDAAAEALNSRWAVQVGERATRAAGLILEG